MFAVLPCERRTGQSYEGSYRDRAGRLRDASPDGLIEVDASGSERPSPRCDKYGRVGYCHQQQDDEDGNDRSRLGDRAKVLKHPQGPLKA